jgi:hypothetical protein
MGAASTFISPKEGLDLRNASSKGRLLAILGMALLLTACIRIGGCREDSLDGTEVRVHFEVTPEQGYNDVHAEVFLDDEMVGSVGNRESIDLVVPSGPHELKVDASGYRAERKSVTIIKTDRQEFHFLLRER